MPVCPATGGTDTILMLRPLLSYFLMASVCCGPVLCAGARAARPGDSPLNGLVVPRSAPRVGRAAPSFRLADTQGQKRSLAVFRGRRVALFVFCGCSWCAAVARRWAEAQRHGALSPPSGAAASSGPAGGSPGGPPMTLVVGTGLNSAGCRHLAERAGLDPAQTILLPDPEGTVADLYQAEPCPRVFAIGADGTLLYVNRGKEVAPRKAPAAAIVAHALAALRAP